jgi:hypothetical protein
VIGGGRLADFSRITEYFLHNTIQVLRPFCRYMNYTEKLHIKQAVYAAQAIENMRENGL